MKRLNQIFQALLGIVALLCTALVAFGRLSWRAVKKHWKKHSKWVRYSLVTVVVLLAAGFTFLIGFSTYHQKHGRAEWNDSHLSQHIVLHSFIDCTYRIYDQSSGCYTTPRINWVSDVSPGDSLAVYASSGKRGFLNVNTGRIVIPAQYSLAWVFSEGLAAVVNEGKIGFINARNQVVIPFQYDLPVPRDPDTHYLFHQGYCTMTDASGKCGLIDTQGRWVIEPSFDEIWAPHESGYRVVVNEGKYGLIDSTAHIVYPTEYDYINVADNGTGFVLSRDGRQWQVDYAGNIVRSFMCDETNWLYYPTGQLENGEMVYELSNYLEYKIVLRYGILDRTTGEAITPAIYASINMLSPTLFEVQDADSRDWYLLDTHGNIVE